MTSASEVPHIMKECLYITVTAKNFTHYTLFSTKLAVPFTLHIKPPAFDRSHLLLQACITHLITLIPILLSSLTLIGTISGAALLTS